jgi:hypothetical protein
MSVVFDRTVSPTPHHYLIQGRAAEIARSLGSPVGGPEHIFLAMLHDGGWPVSVISALVDLAEAEEAVLSILSSPGRCERGCRGPWRPTRTRAGRWPLRMIGLFMAMSGRLARAAGGSGRGGVLESQDEWLETCFARSEGLLDVPRLRRMAGLRAAPRDGVPDVMSRDLVPGNLLVDGGLAGVIDVGSLGPADPAWIVGAWHLLDGGPR